MYIKDFEKWNKNKQEIDSATIPYDFFFHEREVWWVAVGINIDIEINGKHEHFERPVLVVKKFNKYQFWGVPLTSKKKEGRFYVIIRHEDEVSYGSITQIRVFSSKRLLRKIGKISKTDFINVKKRIKSFL